MTLINPYDRLAISNPAMANAGELAQVRQALDFANRKIAAVEGRPDDEAVPQWVAFAAALAVDSDVNALVATAQAAAPVLHLMLGVGLGQAAQGDTKTFLQAWGQGITAGLISSGLAAHVARLAEPFDLPPEFVASLQPTSGTP